MITIQLARKGIYMLVFFMSFIVHSYGQQNFYLENWQPKTFPRPENVVKIMLENGKVNDIVTISPNDTIAPVLSTQLGLNTTFRSGSDMVKKRLANYRNSNMASYRFPAGSGSNIYFWDGKIPDKFLIDFTPIDGTANSALKIHEFVAFIDSLDAEATIVVNYFYARYGITKEGTREARVKQAAEYAAGFVNYVNNVLKANVKSWEVGNECYGKWEEGYDVNGSIVTGKEYGEDFRLFAEKMKAADPSIKVGAVMYPKDDSWNDQVMKEVKNHADFVVVHNYFTPENEATVANILSSTPQINDIKKQMEDCTLRNTDFEKEHFPVAMTEYNCRGPHTTSFVNACFTAEIIGRLIESKYGLATRWVGEWAWKVGTHGLFALEDPDQPDYSVRQAYMVYHYYGKAFGDFLVHSNSNNPDLKVYASRFEDGKIGVVIINPTSTEQKFNLKFQNGVNTAKCWFYEVYANSIAETDKKFYVNGFTSTTKGGGPENFPEIAPFEASIDAETILSARKYSVTFYVFEPDKATGSTEFQNKKEQLKIYPNPASTEIFFKHPVEYERLHLFALNGEQIYSGQFSNPFDVSFLATGSYLLRLDGIHNSASGLILKQ